MAAIKNDDEQLKKENKKEMEEFNTKLAAIKNDNEQLKKEMEEINTKMKEFGSQINYLKNFIYFILFFFILILILIIYND